MDRRNLLGVGIVAVAGGAGWMFANRGGTSEPSNLLVGMANAQEATADTSMITEMVLGDPDAPIEVIEYASYTCPHCASFHANQFPQIKANYIETGKVIKA